jgi:hypothetical protein
MERINVVLIKAYSLLCSRVYVAISLYSTDMLSTVCVPLVLSRWSDSQSCLSDSKQTRVRGASARARHGLGVERALLSYCS